MVPLGMTSRGRRISRHLRYVGNIGMIAKGQVTNQENKLYCMLAICD